VEALKEIRARLVCVVAGIGDGSSLRGEDACVVLSALVGVERAVVAARLVVQRRAVVGEAWKTGGSPSPQVWLAGLTGETPAGAARSLETAEQLAGLPDTSRELAEGRVSATQASLVAAGASVDPRAAKSLRTPTALTR
jgi:hypothetical protein